MARFSSVDNRRARIADIAATRGFDSVLLSSPAGVAYVTDIDVRRFVGPVLARVSADGSLRLTASSNDRAALDEVVPGADVSFWRAEPGMSAGTRAADIAWHSRGRTAAEGRAFVGVAAPEALAAGRDILAEASRTRFDDELALLRDAGRLSEIAYTATVDRMHPELRAFEIARNVDRSLRAAGGGGWWSLDESENGLSSTTSFPEGIVGLLDRRQETGVLDVEDPLPFHLLPLSGAYGVASATTAVLTEPTREVRAAGEALSSALAAALAEVRAHALPGAVDAAFRSKAPEGADFVGFVVGTGPGDPVLAPGASRRLDESSAVSLRASAPAIPGRPRIVFQTTVVVTADGADRLDPVIPLRLIELY